MEEKPKQIEVVELVRGLFESIYGNIGLLKFSIDELKPANGVGQDSDKWFMVCSFYKSLGSSKPSKYKVEVNLKTKMISFEGVGEQTKKEEGTYQFVEKKPKGGGKVKG